ncbi:glycosyltransferase family 2 protein [Mucilaginibacter sp. BT774]|uniref:glycosyltransferase family 2 protein n=1 Tax=Mucilaginibacter sp. BT774 TaxID=3062276 RepID=UPI002674B25A|nr:glycosyltransferase family 2 protein [Mucilaginibacter sp. BT774]MDO3627492.1 glycosyltransferase family 2 protein [Mucilaginibacter sp. BT774]
MTEPLVSIIIPLYNAEKYLDKTIRSALAQSWSSKEIILVDDGSTDDSLNIAREHAAAHSEIIVIHQSNGGASSARNAGLRAAKGEYIQFLDADDLLMPDKIEKQVIQLIGLPSKLSICMNIYFESDEDIKDLVPDPYDRHFYQGNENPFEFLMKLYGGEDNKGGMITIHSWLVPASVIKKAGEWNEKLSINDDGEFFSRVVLASDGILFRPDTFCYYRKPNHSGSLSAQKSLHAFESQLLSLELIENHLRCYQQDKRIDLAVKRMLFELLVRAYPEVPEIAAKAEQRIIDIGGPCIAPVLGGRALEWIKTIFGWKVARQLQYHNPFKNAD